MEYRTSQAETEEQRQKEKNFMGIGLTSRKNLCIHPEVRCRSLWLLRLEGLWRVSCDGMGWDNIAVVT